MKKICTVLTIMSYCFTGFAQQEMTKEQARSICAQEMAAFTNAVSGSYKKGISFEQFQSALCGGLQPAPEGSNQIRTAYNYLSQNIPADVIIKLNDGKEIGYSLNYLVNLHKKGIESDGSELFGGKTGTANNNFAKNEGGCKWYQLLCLMQSFVNWVATSWTDIITMIGLAAYGPFPG